ncbi:MAG: NAD(P)-dependent oxidoreductase [Gammaproteobacteria bacterium]|nr:NAD(P)-dependent oxidoreductase [Gammaproteobacteria bacterium]
MGANMARRLLDAGFSLTVYDTSAKAVEELAAHGAQAAGSPAEAADAAKTLFLSLPTPDIIRNVALGPGGVHESRNVRYVFDCSTTGPTTAREVAAGLAEKNITYLDCPVSGGIAGAKNGTLAVMVSGPRAAYDENEAALKQFGKLFYVGDGPGQGQVLKLANNLLAAAAIVLSSEAVVMGVKAGLDPKQMLDVINAGSGRNSATQDKFPKAVLTRTFDFGFATGLSYKDVKLCIHEAENLGVPTVAGSAVLQMLAVTQARFGADSDFTSIARVVEEWAGVEIKG